MVHALLVCSEVECTAVYEAYGPLEEVQALACDCDCGLEIIGWPDHASADHDARERPVELTLLAA